MTLHIWIGYDEREAICSDVLMHSISKRSSIEVEFHHLKHRQLRNDGLFKREWRIDEKGQYWDIKDGKPFSTQFSHSRFLVPELARREGIKDWVMFVDCDFLFREDIGDLVSELKDQSAGIACVQQHHEPERKSKMDNMQQTIYRSKNWSSLLMFNMSVLPDHILTPEYVNEAAGSSMHGFDWLQGYHALSLDMKWNQLVGEYPVTNQGALHYTNGGPWMWDMTAKTADETHWLIEYADYMKSKHVTVNLVVPDEETQDAA